MEKTKSHGIHRFGRLHFLHFDMLEDVGITVDIDIEYFSENCCDGLKANMTAIEYAHVMEAIHKLYRGSFAGSPLQ